MVMTDPIADMLTRIRNANQQRHDEVVVPASKLKAACCKNLKLTKNDGSNSGRLYCLAISIKRVIGTTEISPLQSSSGVLLCIPHIVR